MAQPTSSSSADRMRQLLFGDNNGNYVEKQHQQREQQQRRQQRANKKHKVTMPSSGYPSLVTTQLSGGPDREAAKYEINHKIDTYTTFCMFIRCYLNQTEGASLPTQYTGFRAHAVNENQLLEIYKSNPWYK